MTPEALKRVARFVEHRKTHPNEFAEDLTEAIRTLLDEREKALSEIERLKADRDRIRAFLGDASPKSEKIYMETMQELNDLRDLCGRLTVALEKRLPRPPAPEYLLVAEAREVLK